MNEELKVIITAECDEMKRELEQAGQSVDSFSKKGHSGGEKFGKAMQAAGKATAAAMKAVATAVAAGVTAMVALSESTREYRESQAKLVSAFESAGSSADQAKETYNDLYRVLGDSDVAVEAANHLAKLTTNEEELSEWTTICEGVYATFGDSLPIEGLTEASNETAKVGQVTGSLADALNWAGVSEDEFNEQLAACNTEAEREALIRTTLNGLYKDAAEAYEKNAKSILDANEAQARMTEALGRLGEAVEPIVTILKTGLAEAIEAILPGLEMVTQGIMDMATGIEGGAEKMAEGVEMMITGIMDKITESLPTLLESGVAILQAIIEGLIKTLPDAIKVFIELIPSIVKAITELLPQLLEAGIQIVLAILDGLTETLPDIIKAVVDMIPEIVTTLVEAAPQILEAAIQLFTAVVEAIPEILPDLIAAIPDIIDTIVEVFTENLPVILDAGIQLFLAVVEAIPEILPDLIAALPDIIDSVVTGLIDAIPVLLDAAVEFFMAIVTALPKIIPALLEAVSSLVSTFISDLGTKIWNGIRSIFSDADSQVDSKLSSYSSRTRSVVEGNDTYRYSSRGFRPMRYANGGVFDKPTMFKYGSGNVGILGEAGAEAVVPLENNTEWLDKVAAMLNEKQGSSGPVVLQVDGRTFAEISIDTINDLTRQQGRLALNVI